MALCHRSLESSSMSLWEPQINNCEGFLNQIFKTSSFFPCKLYSTDASAWLFRRQSCFFVVWKETVRSTKNGQLIPVANDGPEGGSCGNAANWCDSTDRTIFSRCIRPAVLVVWQHPTSQTRACVIQLHWNVTSHEQGLFLKLRIISS